MESVLENIRQAAQLFLAQTGRRPTRVLLRPIDESRLALLPREQVGDLVGEILVMGPRQAIEARGGTLLGLRVQWDSDSFRVE